jgi:hypothetical protein
MSTSEVFGVCDYVALLIFGKDDSNSRCSSLGYYVRTCMYVQLCSCKKEKAIYFANNINGECILH